MKLSRLRYGVAWILFIAWVPAQAQVTTLQCSGNARFPYVTPGSTMPNGFVEGLSGTLVIDLNRRVIGGSLLNLTSVAGIEVNEVSINMQTDSDVVGKRGFMARSGANHSLNVSIQRNTGQAIIYEFFEGDESYKGFALLATCKLAKPLF